MQEVLIVNENGRSLEYAYADLVKYHGYGYLGGVALAFKAMQRVLPILADGLPPERNEIAQDTAFPGPGGRDGFEMVTRMVSGGRYKVDFSIASDDVPKSPTGSYFFRFKYRDRTVDVALRHGIIREKFLRLASQETLSTDERTRLDELKVDMADRLMTQPTEVLFDVLSSATP